MSVASETIRRRRLSLGMMMAAVAFLAADVAVVRSAFPMDFGPFHPLFLDRNPTFPISDSS
jgi:hypothetical protein